MVRVRHLTRRYRTVTAVDDPSVEVSPARVTGFLGPNGAGETITLRILPDLTAAVAGGAATTISLITPGREVT
jgi:ABC-2 type transport system ATP-binding protein